MGRTGSFIEILCNHRSGHLRDVGSVCGSGAEVGLSIIHVPAHVGHVARICRVFHFPLPDVCWPLYFPRKIPGMKTTVHEDLSTKEIAVIVWFSADLVFPIFMGLHPTQGKAQRESEFKLLWAESSF